jgi:DNA polymerase I-like protein with 3'-5' exonuclease and polymerase domains
VGRLPEATGLFVSCDTETSGLFVDDGSRVAVVSYAYREPVKRDGRWIQKPDADIVRGAVAFDQGIEALPLGEKGIASRHWKRINKRTELEVSPDIDGRDVVIPQDEFLRPAPNVDPKWWDVLTEWLDGQRIVWHNAKFDMQQIRAGLRGRPETGRDLESAFYWDTQLAQSVLDPAHGTSLKPTAERLELGREVGIEPGHEADEQRALAPWLGPKTGKNADPRFDLVPWSVMKPYAVGDALLTLLLFEEQGRALDESESMWFKHIDTQFDLMVALYRMENRGIGFDVTGCLVEDTRLAVLAAEAADALPFDPTPDKARRYFFGPTEEDGLGVIPKHGKITDGGKPQVDEEVIEWLTKHGDPKVREVAQGYQLHEGYKSARSKWYSAWPRFTGADGRLRTSYRQARVVSGRLSAERAQLQAIPHDYQIPKGVRSIREFFVPKDGHDLWEIDVANAEPRIATVVAKCEPMYQAVVVDGQDTHSAATKLMFRSTFGDDFGPGHPDWTEYRQVGKRCNLGILYAAGPKTIREQIAKFTGITYELSAVTGWVNMYRASFPQFVAATDYWSRYADKHGFIRTVDGRIRPFQSYEPLHKAFNQVIQGSVAGAMTTAMIDVEYWLPGIMLLQVHDSLVLEVPKGPVGAGMVAMAATIVRYTFEKQFRLAWRKGERRRLMPFPVDCKPFGASALELGKDTVEQMETLIRDGYEQCMGRVV